MRPPYELSPAILREITSISEKIGEVKAKYLARPSPTLRKQNRIKTIHSSLGIEGNTLSREQVTALMDHKRVVGPRQDILEVRNAIAVYDQLNKFNPLSERSFLSAHQILMKGLLEKPGKYRTENVGIQHGSQVTHVAPPPDVVPNLMNDLFKYLKFKDELTLIKSCVFHYELEFIHPFMDGNGRMGRLWQTLILLQEFPVFEYLPFETMIFENQDKYYRALSASDKSGNSTEFIQFMLRVINISLGDLLDYNNHTMTPEERLDYFISINIAEFSRKDYMKVFKEISSATASRDLGKGVASGLLIKSGDKNKTIYRISGK